MTRLLDSGLESMIFPCLIDKERDGLLECKPINIYCDKRGNISLDVYGTPCTIEEYGDIKGWGEKRDGESLIINSCLVIRSSYIDCLKKHAIAACCDESCDVCN